MTFEEMKNLSEEEQAELIKRLKQGRNKAKTVTIQK